MSDIKILQSIHFYDDDDELYAEFQVTFDYKGKKFIVDHIIAYSGAWDYRVISYLPKDFQRLYGGGMEIVSFEQLSELDGEPFSEYELIQAADKLIESGEDELKWHYEDFAKENGEIKFENKGRTDRGIGKLIDSMFGKDR